MTTSNTPVLWVSGAPGTGKTTAGWGLYRRIADRGGSVAYVDIDQLGLIGPPPGGGGASHRIKADNLLRMVATLRRRGVQQVLVSGVVDPQQGIEPYLMHKTEAAHIDLTHVRLTCEREELRRRFLGRGSSPEMLTELFDLVDELDRSDTGSVVDTTGQNPADTVDTFMAWTTVRTAPVLPLPAAPSDGSFRSALVAVVTGATAVGKSTISWKVLRDLWRRNVVTAYVDLGQLGFVHPGPDPALQAAALRSLWDGYRRTGARALLVVAREPASVVDAVPDDPVTVVHLDADAATLAARVRRRADGESALLAGDELRGASPAVQRRVATRAAAEATRLRCVGTDGIILDTSGQNADETAAAVLDALRSAPGTLLTST
ncbi:broad-specificity NMP kinase [Prauserella sediminis]|uniref:Broad-specificity NMP kinase n=1 Tax=Prauserella sediminis TaxID=577680 RepID=A0A839XTL9_9PSEU|nr:AAA family ATPase [Prauserella sediminis]MBB3666077.1 broad-specificity NMP kinase [Prauserella sediminis]